MIPKILKKHDILKDLLSYKNMINQEITKENQLKPNEIIIEGKIKHVKQQ